MLGDSATSTCSTGASRASSGGAPSSSPATSRASTSQPATCSARLATWRPSRSTAGDPRPARTSTRSARSCSRSCRRAPPSARPGGAASTLTGAVITTPARRHDGSIPPELDTMCIAMLATDPTARPTARAPPSASTFLDGDRDVARRRTIAADTWPSRRKRYASADIEARATATQHAGRALALDPESSAAAAIVSRLMLEPARG